MTQNPQFWIFLTWKCASHHNDVASRRPKLFRTQFFFHFQICFVPERRVRYRNFQKYSEHEVFSILSLQNELRTTMAPSQLPKMDRIYFDIFHFQIYFAPQRRISFQYHNFQKRSEHEIFHVFSLQNMFVSQRYICFPNRNFQKRSEHILIFFTSKYGSHWNDVHGDGDCNKTKISQDKARLEAGFKAFLEAGPGGLGYRNQKSGSNNRSIFWP